MSQKIRLLMFGLLLSTVLSNCGGGEAEQRAAEGNPPKSDVALPSHDLNNVRLQPNGGSHTIVFEIAKTIPYFCRTHGGGPGVGESGTISVSGADQPTSRIVNIVGGSPLPDVTVSIGDTVTFVNTSSVEHELQTAN